MVKTLFVKVKHGENMVKHGEFIKVSFGCEDLPSLAGA